MLSKYRSVVFDFDDTLVKTVSVKWAQHKQTARQFYQLEITDEDIQKYWGMPFEQMVSNLYKLKDTPENISKNYHSLDKKYQKHFHDHAEELLNKLFEDEYKVGIVTAMTRSGVTEDLTRLNFASTKFFILQGSEDTEFHKPDPKVFDPIISKLKNIGIQPFEAVYIGDSIKDFQAATGAGMGFIGVTTGLTTKELFNSNGAIAISNLQELIT